MKTTLITLGIVCIIAAIVGGGLKAFQIEIPLLNSIRRQLLLASFGLVLIVVTLFTTATPPPPPPVRPNLIYGTWTLYNAIDEDGNNFSDSTLNFTSQQDTRDGLTLQGRFTWRLNGKPIGTEDFTGHYLDVNRQVILEGTSVVVTDKSHELTPSSYSAVVSADERTLADGRWGVTPKAEPGIKGKWEARR
jgi:hypothetical protein